MFHCENGSWAVAGKVLHDHRGHGRMPFREVIEKSSNIGTVKGAMRLGADKLYHTIRSFGFGQPCCGSVSARRVSRRGNPHAVNDSISTARGRTRTLKRGSTLTP